MGYRIEYDGRAGKYEVRSEGKRFPVLFFCAAAFVAALCLWPQGMESVRSFLIPGEDAVTVQAFHGLTDDLRSGASMEAALEAFCRCVLDGK